MERLLADPATRVLELRGDLAPVEGEPSLRAFLAWLDAVDEAAEVVEATQPAPADSGPRTERGSLP